MSRHETLLRAGWLPSIRDGWWRDPAGGSEMPEWRAWRIAARDLRVVG